MARRDWDGLSFSSWNDQNFVQNDVYFKDDNLQSTFQTIEI